MEKVQSLKKANPYVKHVLNALVHLNERDGSKPKHIFGQVLSDIFLHLPNPLTIEMNVGKALRAGVNMGLFQRKKGNRFILGPSAGKNNCQVKRNVNQIKNADSFEFYEPVDKTRRRRQRRRRRSNRRMRRHDQGIKESEASGSSREDVEKKESDMKATEDESESMLDGEDRPVVNRRSASRCSTRSTRTLFNKEKQL